MRKYIYLKRTVENKYSTIIDTVLIPKFDYKLHLPLKEGIQSTIQIGGLLSFDPHLSLRLFLDVR